MHQPIPIAIQTTYQDLLERHKNRPNVLYKGSLIKKTKSDRCYWIARQRFGGKAVDTQIGPDNQEVRRLIATAKTEQEQHESWRKNVGSLVGQLRGAGARTLDMQSGKILSALARAGFFQAEGMLAGTNAFALYELELGVRFNASMARTEDIDLIADKNVTLIAPNGKGLLSLLDDLGLQPLGGLSDPDLTRWQTKDGIPIDILTRQQRGGKDVVSLKGLGIHAQALPFLEFIMTAPIQAVALYREGILVNIPSPERYAIHKLLVAAARTGAHRAKSAKDLMQAEAIIAVLAEQRPFELKEVYDEATGRGKKWRQMIEMSLRDSSNIANILANL